MEFLPYSVKKFISVLPACICRISLLPPLPQRSYCLLHLYATEILGVVFFPL